MIQLSTLSKWGIIASCLWLTLSCHRIPQPTPTIPGPVPIGGFIDCKFHNIVAEVIHDNRKYYVDVIPDSHTAMIWLRASPNQLSKTDDIPVLLLSLSQTRPEGPDVAICRGKELFDQGKGYAGCLATAGSAACVLGVGETGGAMIPICAGTWEYTFGEGWGDCVGLVKDKIADAIGVSGEWSGIQALLNLSKGQLGQLILRTIDMACLDADNKIPSGIFTDKLGKPYPLPNAIQQLMPKPAPSLIPALGPTPAISTPPTSTTTPGRTGEGGPGTGSGGGGGSHSVSGGNSSGGVSGGGGSGGGPIRPGKTIKLKRKHINNIHRNKPSRKKTG